MMKVLLPVDRARNSLRAERYALELHQKTPLKITLLNVINENVLNDRGIAPNLIEQLKQGQRSHAAKILAEAVKPFKEAGIETDQRIEYGIPGPTICRIAAEEGFDLVLIAEAGLSEGGQIRRGSVVEEVAHVCRVPVTLVKHKLSDS